MTTNNSVNMLPHQEQTPSIRIVPHIEGPRSLHFDIIEREVPEGTVIKIGRFTDKAQLANRVTFKSKVVSRGHAEIWCEGGKFFLRDTKSSSGTFLNHQRLSSPTQESKPYPLNDGDVVQLGVDYQGGTEEIYRCVKMRIQLNRSWQRQINHFNLNALKELKQMTGLDVFKQTSDCCICLCGIGPCQALFLAPCSHVFHYKCIRPILINQHPGFQCPLCRSFADLEASVENTIDWKQMLAEEEEAAKKEEAASTIPNKNNSNNTPEGDQTIIEGQNSQSLPMDVDQKVDSSTGNNETQLTSSITPGQLKSIQINGRDLNSEEIVLLYNALHNLTLEPTTTLSASPTIPIPGNKANHNSSEDNDDPSMSLSSRTLPSSPSPLQVLSFSDESGPSSTLNHQQREHSEALRLGEIAEEDEGSLSSSSTGRLHRNSRTHFSPNSVQDFGSSSASASDDDDGVQPGLPCSPTESNSDDNFNFITSEGGESGFVEVTALNTQNDRVKGKGVERIGLGRKENVL